MVTDHRTHVAPVELDTGRCSVKRAIYHRRPRANVKPALQITAVVALFALLPTFVDSVAQSDLLGPLAFWVTASAAAAFVVWAWPVKR